MTMTMASPEFGAKPVTFKMSGVADEPPIRDDDADAGGRRSRPRHSSSAPIGTMLYMRMPFLQLAAPVR